MNQKVLVFAPHNDDEVLGCGGTIAKFTKMGMDVVVCEVTSGTNVDRVNLIKNEAKLAHKVLRVKESCFLNLPVVTLNSVSKSDINQRFAEIVQRVKPSIAFLPHIGDMHIDHQVTVDAAMVALRPLEAPFVRDIYAYETLSETEWNLPFTKNAFLPNVWIDITEELDEKLSAMECYQTQLQDFPHPRSLKAIESLAAYRGSTIGVAAAEAFMQIRRIQKQEIV